MPSLRLSNLLQLVWVPCEQLWIRCDFNPSRHGIFASKSTRWLSCLPRTAFFTSIHRVSIIFISGGRDKTLSSFFRNYPRHDFASCFESLSSSQRIHCLCISGSQTDGRRLRFNICEYWTTVFLFFLFPHEWITAKSFDSALLRSCHIVRRLFFHTCVDFTWRDVGFFPSICPPGFLQFPPELFFHPIIIAILVQSFHDGRKTRWHIHISWNIKLLKTR